MGSHQGGTGVVMTKEQAIRYLDLFIKEMEHTLLDKDKRNRNYAPQVFWKNKYTLEQIVELLKEELE